MHADLQKNISTLLKIAVLWLKCMQALPTTSIDDPLPVVNDDEPLADFTGHKLVRIRQFDRNQETFLDQLTCDVWGEDEESAEALVHLTPEQYKVILEEPTTFPNITVVSHNLQEMIDIEAMRHQNAKTSKASLLFHILSYCMTFSPFLKGPSQLVQRLPPVY